MAKDIPGPRHLLFAALFQMQSSCRRDRATSPRENAYREKKMSWREGLDDEDIWPVDMDSKPASSERGGLCVWF